MGKMQPTEEPPKNKTMTISHALSDQERLEAIQRRSEACKTGARAAMKISSRIFQQIQQRNKSIADSFVRSSFRNHHLVCLLVDLQDQLVLDLDDLDAVADKVLLVPDDSDNQLGELNVLTVQVEKMLDAARQQNDQAKCLMAALHSSNR